MIRLTARRNLRLPTFWGWLLILAAGAGVLWLAISHLYGFLAVDVPARGPGGAGARTLVVEGWLEAAELDGVPAALRAGHYERVVTTGGPVAVWGEASVTVSSAERAANYLRRLNGVTLPVVAVPAPASAQERTFLSAVMLREWAQRSGTRLEAIDLFTRGVHARRSRSNYRSALGPGVEVGVRAAAPVGTGSRWWASSESAKAVLGEAIGMAWTACCFWPPAPGSHEERWAVPATAR